MTASAWRDPARLISDRMAIRAAYRAWMQPDAYRLAHLVWWGTYQFDDARVEMRLCMVRKMWAAKSSRTMSATTRAFADQVLDDAIAELGAVHERNAEVLRQVAAQSRREGAWGREVVSDVVAAARAMSPLPPPWLVEEAAEPPRPAYRPAARRRARTGGEEMRLHA